MADDNEFPEHVKQAKVLDQSQAIGEFLEWLDESGVVLCHIDTDKAFDEFTPIRTPRIKLLARYFEIDLEKIEAEKRQMLDELRGERG